MRTTFLLIALSAYATLPSWAQSDSIAVFLLVNGPTHERFDVHYKGNHMISSQKGGKFTGSFKIPIDQSWSKRHALDLFISKRRLFGIISSDVSLGIQYNPNFKYLILHRDEGRKRSSPLTFYWSNDKPYIID